MSGQFADRYHYNGANYSIIKREPWKCLDPKEYGLSKHKDHRNYYCGLSYENGERLIHIYNKTLSVK